VSGTAAVVLPAGRPVFDPVAAAAPPTHAVSMLAPSAQAVNGTSLVGDVQYWRVFPYPSGDRGPESWCFARGIYRC
jgi:hypothetical protein